MTNIIATKKTPATPQQPASIDAERNPQSCLCSKPGGARSVQNKVPGCRHTKDCYDHCEVNGKLTGSVPDMVSNMFERVEKYTTHNAPTDLRAMSQLLPKEDRRRCVLRRGPIPNPARGHEILCRCRNCGEHLVQGDIRLYGKDEILQKLLNWTKPGPACVDGDGTVGCRQEFVAVPYENAEEVEDAPETTTAKAADLTPNVEDEPTTEGVVVEETPAEAVAVDATVPMKQQEETPRTADRFQHNPYTFGDSQKLSDSSHLPAAFSNCKTLSSPIPECVLNPYSAAYGYAQ